MLHSAPKRSIIEFPQRQAAPAAKPAVKSVPGLGRERFGKPAGPLSTLVTPVPLGAMLLLAVNTWLLPAGAWPWLTARLTEIAWIALVPFVLAIAGQQLARAVSKAMVKRSGGDRFIDFSARAWHYHVAIAVAAAPLVALQASEAFLDAYLGWRIRLGTLFGSGVAGYDPDWGNLIVFGVLPLVLWQVGRILAVIPAGRLTLFQHELARLRRSVSWKPEAWQAAVTETFDRWFADLMPAGPGARMSGEQDRKARQRWAAFRKEAIASFGTTPPDVERANAALSAFRQGL